jgi:hypothetical protein
MRFPLIAAFLLSPVLTAQTTVTLTANCTITSYGQGCSGVQAVGSQQISLPLPGGCALLSNAEGVALVSADAAGVAIAASNGVKVECCH